MLSSRLRRRSKPNGSVGIKHREIQGLLGVYSSYVSRWEEKYREGGVEKIRLGHKGSEGYLDEEQRIAVIEWIKQKSDRNLCEVIKYLETSYGVIYRSMQSYSQLLKSAGMSWQKGRKKVLATMSLWCRRRTLRVRTK